MAYNNTVILTGNMGSEAKIIEQDRKEFATFSIATVDSYQDDNEQWIQKDSIWLEVLVFASRIIQQVKSLKKGTRLELSGALSYRSFSTLLEDGRTVTKKEASVIVHKVALKPLVKRSA